MVYKKSQGDLVIKVEFEDVSSGVRKELLERNSSQCPFYYKFKHRDYYVQLRLDWSDLVNGEPMLDADIWKEAGGQKKALRNGEWHHTKKEYHSEYNRNVYIFEFEDLRLVLGTKTTSAKLLRTRLDVRAPEKQQ